MPLPRECKKCGIRFQPTGRGNWLCDKCLRKIQLNTAEKRAELYYKK